MIKTINGANYRLLWQVKGQDIEGQDFFNLEAARDLWSTKKNENVKHSLDPFIINIKPYRKDYGVSR